MIGGAYVLYFDIVTFYMAYPHYSLTLYIIGGEGSYRK